MHKVAVMGDRDSIYGFAALGLEIWPADDAAQASQALHKMAGTEEYAVIYITEALAEKIPEEIAKYTDHICPAIILLPGVVGNTGAGLANVRKTVERAVGSDILN